MKSSAAFAAVIATASAITSIELKYANYLAEFGKIANDADEFNMRMENFAVTDKFIEENNSSGATHVAGHNQFSDWTPQEYSSLLGYQAAEEPFLYRAAMTEQLDETTAASSINWVSKGAVTGVKDQGHGCSSCWTFSSTGALEGAHFVRTKQLKSFSEEQLVACVGHGCGAGNPNKSFEYWKSHAAYLESVYPYTSGSGTTRACRTDSSKATSVKVSNYTRVTASNVSQMKAAVTKQPVSIAVDSSSDVFRTYKSNVITSSSCGTSLNHAVLAVGYGTENGHEYWLVKNSWNTSWGEKGYVKIGIVNGKGICGVQMDPKYPTSN